MKGLILTLVFILHVGVIHAQAVYPYAEKLEWDDVNEILPRYSKFTVVDLETGKKFKVQRRAGSQHADVQPLTVADTKIMKEIYNGKWSWKRRAIIVLSGKKKIAASMHGMPHGAGALKNNFPGHFCIHFFGSTTHRTNFMDLSHKLMILKAANELADYLNKADPYELANAYFAGLKQQDEKILSETSLQEMQWSKIISEIDNLNVDRMAMLPAEDLKNELVVTIPIALSIYKRGHGLKRYEGTIVLVRFAPIGRWQVDSNSVLPDLCLIEK